MVVPEQNGKPTETVSRNAMVATKPYSAVTVPPQHPADPGPSRDNEQRPRRWPLLVALAIGLAIIAAVLYRQPWKTTAATVAVEVVAPGPITRVLAINGRIAALRSVDVKSTVAGTLTTRMAQEGDVVQQGAVLATLDDTSQTAAVRQSIATLQQAQVAQSQASEALDRAEALGENVSRMALEDARHAMARADQEVGRLRALVDQAQFLLTKFSIVAPIAGTVLKRNVDPGQVVDLSTPLFTLADLSDLVVETNVDELYATQIKVGMPALLQLTGATSTQEGHVTFVAPVVDAGTGGLAVKIAFDKPQLAPVGLTVTANIIVERKDKAISAPRAAIVTSGQDHAVFLVATDGKAHKTAVNVIDWPAERLLVTDGLKAGDRLIVDANGLADGKSVKVKGP
ncbi:efflux RND transporter periplasmic adaptor subunit [Rhizobium sp. C4]|uniref:efflux RND transporter periplasmic adaptor subunit n=1 Tax=Rhizobium sp. C4 TaxID=1349800 RepID=UPI001E4EF4E3|nr:efflux RND transporter periplasmic adaptor subunit [Rhizobium sp. C4]MCD2175760.1 efflux RND transporter periplasmic adaptor subunit [Rhizobium sp. C4]